MNRMPARYDEVADFYEAFAPDVYDDPPTAALLSLVGEVSGLRLLDVACGHGRVTRELARRGAGVVGLDISAALLDKARAREQLDPLGITYVRADAASPDALMAELFDGAVCHFGLSDIDDLQGAVATVARVLRPGGFRGGKPGALTPVGRPVAGTFTKGGGVPPARPEA
jgi:ubiquinone/menaquinone biosynthesis C-methylase UbiE